MTLFYEIIIYIIYFITLFFINKLFFWFKKPKKNKSYNLSELIILEKHFKVPVKNYSIDKLLNIISLGNAFVFLIVITLTQFIDNYIIRITIIFMMLIPLIYLVYFLIGKYLGKSRS